MKTTISVNILTHLLVLPIVQLHQFLSVYFIRSLEYKSFKEDKNTVLFVSTTVFRTSITEALRNQVSLVTLLRLEFINVC